ncbi:hypothetical protein CLIM01_13324 [Colletotrichum limetticola]|uniref:Mating type protein 1-2-1 n=1 Tax=Colletotrichum limetticola TaxID=1209924 RepID=A0ABQ9PH99_9PEZI|nr:hypothetical protein CLIM01_13324 [Colletotrichum limetticola]
MPLVMVDSKAQRAAWRRTSANR